MSDAHAKSPTPSRPLVGLGLFVVGVGLVGWFGCSGPPPTSQDAYEKGLVVQAQRAGGKLLIGTHVNPPAAGYFETRDIYVSTGGEPIQISRGRGPLGKVTNANASVGTVGKKKEPASAIKEVIVKYKVYQGASESALPLFEGERRLPVDP